MSLSSNLEENRFFFRLEDKRNITFSQTLLIHSISLSTDEVRAFVRAGFCSMVNTFFVLN